jgi:hypothetical protein
MDQGKEIRMMYVYVWLIFSVVTLLSNIIFYWYSGEGIVIRDLIKLSSVCIIGGPVAFIYWICFELEVGYMVAKTMRPFLNYKIPGRKNRSTLGDNYDEDYY